MPQQNPKSPVVDVDHGLDHVGVAELADDHVGVPLGLVHQLGLAAPNSPLSSSASASCPS